MYSSLDHIRTIARQYHFRLFRILLDYFVSIIFYHLSNVSGRYKWGKGERKGRDREGQVGQTKHRKHQYISSRCRTPTSVAFVIGIFAKIPYWAGIHVTYYRWNPTLVTGCIVILRVISGNIAFGKGFIFVSVSIIIGILRFISIYFVLNFYFSIAEVCSQPNN